MSKSTRSAKGNEHYQAGKNFARWIPRVVGPTILLAIILFSVDLKQAVALLFDVDLRLVATVTFVIFPLLVLLRSYRWHLIAHLYQVRYPFKISIELYLAAFSAGFLLSDGLSSFVRSFFLYNDGYSVSKSVLVPFWDKAVELTSLLLLGGVALLTLPQVVLKGDFLYLVAIILVCIFALVAVLGSRRMQEFLLRKLLPLIAKQVKRLETVDTDALLADIQAMRLAPFAGLVLYSSLVRLVHFAGVYLLALALALPLTYWQVALVMALAAVVVMLPISIAGLGTREAVLIPTLALFGQPPEAAVALSFLIALTSTAWRALGSVVWFLLPLRKQLAPTVEDSV